MSGDVRRALELCRKAAEVAEEQQQQQQGGQQPGPSAPAWGTGESLLPVPVCFNTAKIQTQQNCHCAGGCEMVQAWLRPCAAVKLCTGQIRC